MIVLTKNFTIIMILNGYEISTFLALICRMKKNEMFRYKSRIDIFILLLDSLLRESEWKRLSNAL